MSVGLAPYGESPISARVVGEAVLVVESPPPQPDIVAIAKRAVIQEKFFKWFIRAFMKLSEKKNMDSNYLKIYIFQFDDIC